MRLQSRGGLARSEVQRSLSERGNQQWVDIVWGFLQSVLLLCNGNKAGAVEEYREKHAKVCRLTEFGAHLALCGRCKLGGQGMKNRAAHVVVWVRLRYESAMFRVSDVPCAHRVFRVCCRNKCGCSLQ